MLQKLKDGEILKNYLKGTGIKMETYAEKLEMTRQNLSYHLRKDVLDGDFERLIKDKLKIDFSNVKRDYFASFTEPGKLTEQTTGLSIQPGDTVYSTKQAMTQEQLETMAKGNDSGISPVGQSVGDKLRMQKATGEAEDEGLIVVPIRAQAGYSTRVLDPLYTKDFKRMRIPDMPYKGDRYRVFEVEGSSMEPTLKQFYLVITERVDQEDWNQTANFYIYVIVTEDRVIIKRLFNKNKDVFVAISDNNEFYPQFFIQKKDIKELWLVKRKVDWEMPPPMKFDIEI